MTYQIKSLEEALPGDVIFFSPRKEAQNWENSAFQIGQTFFRSVCSEGIKQTHAGVIVDPDCMEPFIRRSDVSYELYGPKGTPYCSIISSELKHNYIWISHNYGSFRQNHIVIFEKKELAQEYEISVVSSDVKKEENPEDFRKIVSQVAFCFSRSIPYCSLFPCSPVHLWIDPIFNFPLSEDRILYSIAAGILCFAAGCPDIESFEEKILTARKTFCAEYVHRSLQVAYGYKMLDPETRKGLQERFSSLVHERKFEEIVRDLEKNHKDCVESIYKDLQLKLPMIPDWILENSVSCTPGRLYTLMTSGKPFKEEKVSYVFRTSRVGFEFLRSSVKSFPAFFTVLFISLVSVFHFSNSFRQN